LQSKDDNKNTGNVGEPLYELQEYIRSLSDEDSKLITTIPLGDTAKIISVSQEQFDKLISESLSLIDLGKLTEGQLERRGQIIEKIWKIRGRLIIKKYGEQGAFASYISLNEVKEILYKAGIREIEDFVLSQLQNSIAIGVYSYDGPVLAVANLERKEIVRAYVKKYDTKDEHPAPLLKTETIQFKEIVFGCCPVNVVINYDEITNSTKYKVTFISSTKTDEITIGPCLLEEIIAELKRSGYVFHGRLAEDTMNIIISALKTAGKVRYTNEIEKTGFYLSDDDRITCNKRSFVKPTVEEAKTTCLFLESLYKQWRPGIVPTVLKFYILSPFGYVLKQYYEKKITNKWLPILYLFGERDSGKNVLAYMGEYMWNLSHEEYEVPASGANTETRFGEAVSRGTFPIFVDEIEKLLETHSQLLSIIKTSVQNKTARIVYTRSREKIEVPALATIIFASNPEPPLDDAANKRFICLRFTKKDTKSKDEQHRFEKEIFCRYSQLAVLANFVAEYIMNNPQRLFANEDWHITGTNMLKEFYNYAGVQEPGWIDEFAAEDRYLENTEEKIANIKSYILNSINNTIAKMSRNCLTSPIGDKIINCYTNNLIPWLDYNPVTKEIIITREIVYDLKQFYRINSLQLLAETVNWYYNKQYWIKKSAKNISCVHVKIEEFLEFLTNAQTQEIQTASNPCLN
jgi:hypothetical protein